MSGYRVEPFTAAASNLTHYRFTWCEPPKARRRFGRPYVWTVAEIQKLATFGNEHGWFHGLVCDEGRVRLAEILPGLGYTHGFYWRSPKSWWWLVRDLLLFRGPKPEVEASSTEGSFCSSAGGGAVGT